MTLLAACCFAFVSTESASAKEPSVAAQRDLAHRFAEAIFHGKSEAAVALLAHPDDAALSWLATHAAASWKTHHAVVHLSGARSGRGWIVGYAGTHPQKAGQFEEVRGDMVVVVAGSLKGARVEFFTFQNAEVQFRTHHDSQLLPSDR